MQKEGYKEATILRYTKILRTIQKVTQLFDSESVKSYLAKKDWSEGTKEVACDAYSLLAKSKGCFSSTCEPYRRLSRFICKWMSESSTRRKPVRSSLPALFSDV
jgi:hypothetical protein